MGFAEPNFPEAELIRPHGRPLPRDLETRIDCYYIQHSPMRLRVLLARPKTQDSRGTLIFSPGRTEFIEKYLETLDDLTGRGFTVLIMDPRGQGLSGRMLSDPLTCYVRDFQHYADDLAYAVEEFSPLLPKPHILMGHSMGGTIVLQAILSGIMNPSAVICSAPMLGLFDLETSVMSHVIRGFSKLGLHSYNLPFRPQRDGLPVPFEVNKLTSDIDRFRLWASYLQTEPRLRVGPPSFGWVSAALKSMSFVNRNADKLKIPSLIVAAGADPIVDPASNRTFAELSGATFHVVPGAMHELLLERDVYRNEFFSVFDKFLFDNAL